MESFFGWAGVITGVLGIFFAWYFYVKALQLKKPSWNFKNVNFIRDSITQVKGLTVLYEEKEIPCLSVGKLAFWNEGTGTIHGTDITVANPLRIDALGDSKILNTKILVSNHPENQLNVDVDSSGDFATITFDYLDKDHGCIIEVVHTGETAKSIKVTGSIKGVTELKMLGVSSSSQTRLRKELILILGIVALIFGTTILSIPASHMFFSYAEPLDPGGAFASIFLSVVFIFYGIIALRRYRMMNFPYPKGLKIDDE